MFGFAGLVIGVLLAIAGVFLIIFFPASTDNQPESMALTAIAMGVVFLVIAAALIFL